MQKSLRTRGPTLPSVLIVLTCLGSALAFAPAGVLVRPGFSHALRPMRTKAGHSGVGMLHPCRTPDAGVSPADQRPLRTLTVLCATAEQTELDSEVLKQSILVQAPLDDCFHVAADLDGYRQWCAKGGMKKVTVLERNDDRLATKVELCAGKLGVDMLNVMEYSYEYPGQVIFKSIEGDVMKRLEGRYIFKPDGTEAVTEVTYELDIEFGFPLPTMVRNQICGAIMRTALTAFKSHTETLSRDGTVERATQTLKR